jgi:hypothetical protein
MKKELTLDGKKYRVQISGKRADGSEMFSVKNVTSEFKTPYLKEGSPQYNKVLDAAKNEN